MIRDLFDAARARLNIETNAELGRLLGVGRAFMCNMQNGRKAMPLEMAVKLTEMCDFLQVEYESLLAKGTDDDALPGVPEVQRQIQHESGVLPDQASGDSPGVAAQLAPDQRQAGAGEGRSESVDLFGECGESPSARVPRKEKLKRGTRSGTILMIGYTYYPDKHSVHTHRRIVGIVRRPEQPVAIVYSIGGDNNLVCDRNTFIRWMDPTRYHNGQTEVRLAQPSPAPDQPDPAPKAKRVRKARAADAPVPA